MLRWVPLLIFAAATTVGAAAAAPDASSPPVVIVHEPHLTGYHMPSASMEPTLQCAHPAPGCEAAYPDRLVVQSLKRAPQRGDILVFRAPALARVRCAATGTYVKRLIGLPGETVSEPAVRRSVWHARVQAESVPYLYGSRCRAAARAH